MKAIAITEFGDADVLQAIELDIPQMGPNQVLIKAAAAGVNRPDIMQRQGVYPPPPGASEIPGLEVAGEIVEIGSQVSEKKIGDQVCALLSGGGYAEYCVAEADLCLPIPDSISIQQAAGIPEVFFTVWSNLFDRGGLQADETLLVHGGGSGIGSAAIQLAKAFGANVIVTAGSDKKCRYCLDLGADEAINYQQQDFVEEVSRLTEGRGADVILDMVGGDYLQRNIKALAVEGRLLQIAIQQGAKATLNLWTVMQKRLHITGSTLRSRDTAFKAAIAANLQQQVWPLFQSGLVKSQVDKVFPLSQVAEAHRYMESSEHMGKIILVHQ